LHEEAVAALKLVQSQEAVKSPTSEDGNGWLEVGNKGRAASTRKTVVSESPITKIFGGNLRSEFKVPGSKPSVTLEPYQPLQLDIAPPQVTSIVDALKQMTKPETIQGDFGSRGNGTATKQVLIDTLPPVLILHLKRFQYDNTGGTQKIWKTIGYPLILEVPPEVLSPINRGKPKPKYRLTGVIYHHGKFATGGHYTADVLRQDGKSWIRLDDTKISKVSPLDVAVSLSPEQAKAIAAEQLSDDDDHLEGPWEHANGSNGTTPKVNGKAKKPVSAGSKDGKVAYILFYQRI
jgi:ubiquitin carboxyl-terminal hydrolase 10